MKMNFTTMNLKALILTAAVLLSATVSGFAATTGTVTLSGTVPPVLAITVTSQTGYNTLSLASDATDALVAVVNELTNRKVGYTVSLASTNASGQSGNPFFKSADPANADVLSYSITYGGAPVTLANGSAVVTNASGRTGSAGVNRDVRISFTGSSQFLNEDTYADTLTFTIAAK
jgi:hypothetical protein